MRHTDPEASKMNDWELRKVESKDYASPIEESSRFYRLLARAETPHRKDEER